MQRLAVMMAAAALLFGCGASGGTTKAGSASSPVTLRIGTDDRPGRPSEGQITEFARQVKELSGGKLTIEPVWHAAGDVDHADQAVARMVESGQLEMGLIPARAWDTEGVTSLRALNAPFLVTSNALEQQVVSSDLADKMLAGLDKIDLTGLALYPDGLRRLFVFGDGPSVSFDVAGKGVHAPKSATTYAILTALGARPVDTTGTEARRHEIQTGAVAAAESEFAFAPGLAAPATTAANMVLYPRVNSLVINAKSFKALSKDQQKVLRDAAARTRDWANHHMQSDADGAMAFCRSGGRVVDAPASQVAAAEKSAQAVYDELDRDAVTKALLERIRAMKAAAPAPSSIAPCEPAATSNAPADAARAIGLDGVYRQDVSTRYLIDAGVSEAMARQESGLQTWTLHDGTFRLQYQAIDCKGTYEIAGDRVTFRPTSGCSGDWSWTATIDGDHVTWSDAEALAPANGPEDQTMSKAIAGVPWTKVGGPVTGDDVPQGTFRKAVTMDALLAAGIDRATAVDHAGMWELTFNHGKVNIKDTNASSGKVSNAGGPYCIADGRVTLGLLGNPPACGDFWNAGWKIDGDKLQFVELKSDSGSDLLLQTIFGGTAWTRVS